MCYDAEEAIKTVECPFDYVAVPVELIVSLALNFVVGARQNDWCGSTFLRLIAKVNTVVAPLAISFAAVGIAARHCFAAM